MQVSICDACHKKKDVAKFEAEVFKTDAQAGMRFYKEVCDDCGQKLVNAITAILEPEMTQALKDLEDEAWTIPFKSK